MDGLLRQGRGLRAARAGHRLHPDLPQHGTIGRPVLGQELGPDRQGEIRLEAKGAKTIEPGAGSEAIAAAFNPIGGGGACATADGADQPGAASYRLEPAPEGGYTLMGAPTVIAKFTLPGENSQVAARLLDVGPDGQETLVARGLWRPATGGPTKQVFQLHPNGWTFAEGHVPKLELLPEDANAGLTGGYGQPSNDQQAVGVKQLELRLPVIEKPGSFKGLVGAAAERFLPESYELAADFVALATPEPKLKRKLELDGAHLTGKLKCPGKFAACNQLEIVATASGSNATAAKRVKVAKGGRAKVAGGKSKRVRLELTRAGRKLFRDSSKLKLKVEMSSAELAEPATQRVKAVAKRR